MAKRPRRFKKVSVSFPIDLYLKVDAAVKAAAPHGMSSWIAEACRAALPKPKPLNAPGWDDPCGVFTEQAETRGAASAQVPEFHREAFVLVAPRLTDAQVPIDRAPREPMVGEGIANMLNRGEDPTGNAEPPPPTAAKFPAFEALMDNLESSLPEAAAQELARREFGPQVLAAAARSVAGWGKWDWKQRLEHLRELKAAAVSG